MRMQRIFFIPLFLLALAIGGPVYSADFQKGVDAYRSKDFKAAINEFRPLVDNNFAPAQYFMAIMYLNGYGLPRNPELSFALFKLSAEQGFEESQFSLGLMYMEGFGILKDPLRSYMWLTVAHLRGFEKAKIGLKEFAGRLLLEERQKAEKLAQECIYKNFKGC